MSATQPVTVPSRGRRVVARALGLAELGHAQWFFGNCYEAIVRVPDLLAEHARASEQAMSPIGSGSPVRYYIAAAPGTLPAIVVATIVGRRDRNGRPWLVTAAVCSIAGAGVTAYLVRTVNRELFFSNQALTTDERERLLRRWYRLNVVRLAATAGAWLAVRTARSRLPR